MFRRQMWVVSGILIVGAVIAITVQTNAQSLPAGPQPMQDVQVSENGDQPVPVDDEQGEVENGQVGVDEQQEVENGQVGVDEQGEVENGAAGQNDQHENNQSGGD